MKLSDYVIKWLEEKSVQRVFMLPGGGAMHLVDSLGSSKKIHCVPMLHEQSCAIAADAYAQYTGNTGVVLVTTGPGATNVLTGMSASWIDGVPVIFIGGQVKREDMIGGKGIRQMGPQEVDMTELCKSITKYSVTVKEPTMIRYYLEKALYFATTGKPGPVWIEIPLDVQATEIDDTGLDSYTGISFSNFISAVDTKKISKLLEKAERPVIILGNGARSIDVDLADWLGYSKIPILTTWRAVDLIAEDYPYYFGRPGTVGQRAANFIQQKADLIISIGARLDLLQVGFSPENFALNAKKIIVDIDKRELTKYGKNFKIDYAINTTAEYFIRTFFNKKISNYIRPWIDTCNKLKKKYPNPDFSALNQECVGINTYKFVDLLSNVLTKDDIIVPSSSGSAAEITLQTFKVKYGQRIINSPGLGSMGFGLPAAIGACLAGGGNRRVISIIGDGDLQHNIQELSVIKRLELPIKIFILNNNGYASIRNMQEARFNGRRVACDCNSGVLLPSICNVAKTYEIDYDILNENSTENDISKIINRKGSVICELMIDPNLQTLPKVSSAVNNEGKLMSAPMEDLYPFRVREEFNKVMEE